MVHTRLDITEQQWRRIKALAAEKGMPIQTFLVHALATSKATQKAF